jgi:hypothetical protein
MPLRGSKAVVPDPLPKRAARLACEGIEMAAASLHRAIPDLSAQAAASEGEEKEVGRAAMTLPMWGRAAAEVTGM